MIRKEIKKDFDMADCGIRNLLDRVGDKWSLMIVDILSEGTLRYSELDHKIASISQKMLTVTLKSLETDGLIDRKVYPQVPPRVEYSLTVLGESLLPSINMLKKWAADSQPAILEARSKMITKAQQS
ncbi:helix-turn-helix domain-containing protein [Pedobacter sp. MC2016-15]|uniref:winged helix-turn-helix transcriptional regulator n=1 Tax=Pedobacter sp. MC2016-15 TaxID=2994473 RepID=UPI002245FF7C|nr:helix-turn-helix domain-containing protein [Pedobacter sp. MC2016-15]MCX2477677.1 helix-turn-helix domain-containing protein [Pedobacter sp. MC2016-15]